MQPGHLWWDSGSGDARDVWRKTALYGSRARARGTAAIIPLSGSAPEQTTDKLYLACVEPSPCTPNSEAALAQRHWPTSINSKITQGNTQPENHFALPLCGATHPTQVIRPYYHCACISGKTVTGRSLLPEWTTVWLRRITGISGPITDGNWSCCDLWLLQEPVDSELAANLMLYQPDGPHVSLRPFPT